MTKRPQPRASRPRSAQQGWGARLRLTFIDDALAALGHIRREMIADFFNCDLSLASLDLTAYREAGGLLEQRWGVFTPTGTFTEAGAKSGGKPYYFAAPDWEPVFDSTVQRQAAWELIAAPAINNKAWVADRQKDWVADHPHATPREMAAYFGIGEPSATRGILAVEASRHDPRRAKIWGIFSHHRAR